MRRKLVSHIPPPTANRRPKAGFVIREKPTIINETKEETISNLTTEIDKKVEPKLGGTKLKVIEPRIRGRTEIKPKIKLPRGFNPEVYKKLNPDLSGFLDRQAINHYIEKGHLEGRKWEIEIPIGFNWNEYIRLNNLRGIRNENQAKEHYKRFGFLGNLKYSTEEKDNLTSKLELDIRKLLVEFNIEESLWKSYIEEHPDIINKIKILIELENKIGKIDKIGQIIFDDQTFLILEEISKKLEMPRYIYITNNEDLSREIFIMSKLLNDSLKIIVSNQPKLKIENGIIFINKNYINLINKVNEKKENHLVINSLELEEFLNSIKNEKSNVYFDIENSEINEEIESRYKIIYSDIEKYNEKWILIDEKSVNFKLSGINGSIEIISLFYNNSEIISDFEKNLKKLSNYVFLLIDNNSTDDTYSKLKELNEKYTNTRLLKNKENGCSSGRNLGLKNISKDTKYVLFLDSDHIIENKLIIEQMKSRINNEIKYVGYYGGCIDNDKSVSGKLLEKNVEYEINKDDNMYLGCGCSMVDYGYILEKKIVFDINFDPFTVQDVDFSYQIKKDKKLLKLVVNNEIIHNEHATTSKFTRAFKTELLQRNSKYFIEKYKGGLIKKKLIDFGATHIHISKCLSHLDRIKTIFSLDDSINDNKDLIIFGLYDNEDYKVLINHKKIVYVIWGGTDEEIINSFNLNILKSKKNLVHLAISKDMYDRLKKRGFNNIIEIELDLTDYSVFKPIDKTGNKIFIYNGYTKDETMEKRYGKEIYEEVMKRLPEYEYIFSNQLGGISNNEMYDIYKECFIGLRLTKKDGNANMVSEMKAMGIPVIHNLSEYGIKWGSIEDIVRIIENQNKGSKYDFLCYYNKHILETYIGTRVNYNFLKQNNLFEINLANFILNKENIYDIINKNKKNKYLIIDGFSLNLFYKLSKINIFSLLSECKIFNIFTECFFLVMDIHDYSYEEITGLKYSIDIKHEILEEKNIYKTRLVEYLRTNNLRIISWQYGKELLNLSKLYNLDFLISNGFLYFENKIFKNLNFKKTIDIFAYGNYNEKVYPLRAKIKNTLQKSGEFKIETFNVDYTKQNELVEKINYAWLTIACTSVYDYFVRKYIEIVESNSVIIGNINKEGKYFIGENFVYIDNEMSEDYIITKTKYYLKNKFLLEGINKLAKKRIKDFLKKKSIEQLLTDNNNKKLIEQYENQQIYDFIHLFDNNNELSTINIDKLCEFIKNYNKIEILNKIERIIVILTNNNNFDNFSDNFYSNYIIIKTDNLEKISLFLKFSKIIIIDNSYKVEKNQIDQIKNDKIIILSSLYISNYDKIIYYNDNKEIELFIYEIFSKKLYLSKEDLNEYILLSVGSGKLDYGGIAVVSQKLLELMINMNLKVNLFLYGNHINEQVGEHFFHHKISNFLKDINNYVNDKTKIIILNWLPDNEIKLLPKLTNKKILLVPGLIRENLNKWILDDLNNLENLNNQMIKTIKNVDKVIFQTKLVEKVFFENIKYSINHLIFPFNSVYFDYNSEMNKKKYDLGFIVSNFNRKIKNPELAIKIIEKILEKSKYKVLIVGMELLTKFKQFYEKNKINIDYFDYIDNIKCQKLISETKIILCTSFFDALPTVTFECYSNKTYFLTTNNCGSTDFINSDYIIKNDYDNIDIWISMFENIYKNNPKINDYYNFNLNLSSKFFFKKLINSESFNTFQLTQNIKKINNVWFDNISEFFKHSFKNNYKLTEIESIDNINTNCIYFGICQAKTLKTLSKFKKNIIIFIGSDSYFFINEKDKGHLLPYIESDFFVNNYFIAISPWIEQDLINMNVPKKNYKCINLLGSDINKILKINSLKKRGEFVYLYTTLNDTYNLDYLMRIYVKIKSINNNIKFHICTNSKYYEFNKDKIESFNNSERNLFFPNKIISVDQEFLYNKIYPNVFIGLRLTNHDGNSNTVCELGMYGIKVIHNGNQPNIINYDLNNFDEIIGNILFEFENRNINYEEISNNTKKYLLKSINTPWYYDSFWENN